MRRLASEQSLHEVVRGQGRTRPSKEASGREAIMAIRGTTDSQAEPDVTVCVGACNCGTEDSRNPSAVTKPEVDDFY